MNCRLLFLLFSVSIFSPSCEPDTESGFTWLEIHVTENGGVPDNYKLKVFQDDKLVTSDEFDLNDSRRNVTELRAASPGLYYVEAKNQYAQGNDTISVSGTRRKIIELELAN
ncbi:hypothetical protein [Tunicatimonas pelagia]|uniref:hypothetical protein n=1 Tax=Tunicatimonas pelagia TaxID=931531 RepID=UPI002665BB42|nr:hypothetical protein [Tunicatimonas pelagia]WKN44247.1 hypothetical protein P0M28_04625 [Tunicatimonas pelagia]